MGLVVLHSGHFSKIFKKLMGTTCDLKWREADDNERIWVLEPGHPIAAGLGAGFIGVELALIQRFTLAAGGTLYATSLVLFGLLAWCAVGALLLSGRWRRWSRGAAGACLTAAVVARHRLPVSEVRFVPAGVIPRTTSGKLARPACRAEYLAGTLGVRHGAPAR